VNKYNVFFILKEDISATENATYSNNITDLVDCFGSDDEDIYCTFPSKDYRVFYSIGQSMLPFFEGENEMLLCNNNFTLVQGQIYAYFDENIHDVSVVHRCIEMTETGCLFKGDNNNFFENITSDKILCKVEWLIRAIN
jgi:hypothetical protein